MKEKIAAADANRGFSRLLRSVREERASYVVTSHGKPVARIVPFDADADVSTSAYGALLTRLESAAVADVKPWSRNALYERDE